jgi:hypothetical protein
VFSYLDCFEGGEYSLSPEVAQRMLLQWLSQDFCIIKREDLPSITMLQKVYQFDLVHMSTDYSRFLSKRPLGSIKKSSPLSFFKLAFQVMDRLPVAVLDVDVSEVCNK